MALLRVTGRSGELREIEARSDLTVMEAIRDAGIEGMMALCGGCLSCGTCHVHVDETGYADLPRPGAQEERFLASLSHRCPTSRLACQIYIEEAGSGLAVTIAHPE